MASCAFLQQPLPAAKKLWNTNKRHHIVPIGLARLERLPEKPAELIVALAGPLSMRFLNNNWFYNVSRKCRGAMAQLSSGVNANNFFLHFSS
jgi:hypothetical protein